MNAKHVVVQILILLMLSSAAIAQTQSRKRHTTTGGTPSKRLTAPAAPFAGEDNRLFLQAQYAKSQGDCGAADGALSRMSELAQEKIEWLVYRGQVQECLHAYAPALAMYETASQRASSSEFDQKIAELRYLVSKEEQQQKQIAVENEKRAAAKQAAEAVAASRRANLSGKWHAGDLRVVVADSGSSLDITFDRNDRSGETDNWKTKHPATVGDLFAVATRAQGEREFGGYKIVRASGSGYNIDACNNDISTTHNARMRARLSADGNTLSLEWDNYGVIGDFKVFFDGLVNCRWEDRGTSSRVVLQRASQ